MTQRFVDAWMAFPGLLLLLTIMSIAGRGMLQIIIVLGVSGGIPASRVVRGAVLGVKENVYFQAAQAIGAARAGARCCATCCPTSRRRSEAPLPAVKRVRPEGPALALLRIATRHPRVIRENTESVA